MAKQTILYTGKGDQGYTSLLGMEQVTKYDLRPEAYGTVDEASAFMGLVRAESEASERTRTLVLEAQRDLWLLMGELATPAGVKLPRRLEAERVLWLEEETEQLGREFPPLTNFVIPGDTKIGALLDVARTIVRRAERLVARLLHEGYIDNPQILPYLNRLSSLLFALARFEEHRLGLESTLAKKVKPPKNSADT